MSRDEIPLGEERLLVFGYDPEFGSYYAQIHDGSTTEGNDGQSEEIPVVAVGFHPIEQEKYPGSQFGPYPATLDDLDRSMLDWGLSLEIRMRVGASLANQDSHPLEGGLYTVGEKNERAKEGLKPFLITSAWGRRVWWSTDEDHAVEQHGTAFPDEGILGDPEEGE